MIATLLIVGVIAGLLSGAVGFGGGMIILPVITYFYGVEVAVPVSTIAQLVSNFSKMWIGRKEIKWQAVGNFTLLAVPFTAMGAFGFAKVPKGPLTIVLCCFLILFAILKLRGKMQLPHRRSTVVIGGGATGFVNGFLGISGPMSSAVFLALDLTPVSYIASEATAASVMHIVKTIVYGRMNLMSWQIFFDGMMIGGAMMLGNIFAMHFIRNFDHKKYRKVVAAFMIAVSLWMIVMQLMNMSAK